MPAEIIPFDQSRVPLEVSCRPLPETRTANNPLYWVASCEVDGRTFEARSRRDAPRELARVLLAAGIPDRPLRISYAGVKGARRYSSFHAEAASTTVESASTPVRRSRYAERTDHISELEGSEPANGSYGTDQKMRNRPVAVSQQPPEADPHQKARASTQICDGCGAEFVPARKWSTFCSGACRQAAYRERRRVLSTTAVLVSHDADEVA
jgi:hypothetical protein